MKAIIYLSNFDKSSLIYNGQPVQLLKDNFKGDKSCVQIKNKYNHKTWVSAWEVYGN